jgi:hypothetical protein
MRNEAFENSNRAGPVMDNLTIREMRIAGITIATTVIALSFAEIDGHASFNFLRVVLALLALGLVLWSGRYNAQIEAGSKA